MKKDTSWGKVASWYHDTVDVKEDSYQRTVILPNLLRLLDIKRGDAIVDIACGTGFFAATFNDNGAKVIGIDIAKELIDLARKNHPGPDYFVSSADDLSMVPTMAVDKATCILAIQNFENVKGMLTEAQRILKPGGKLFIVMNHPVFRIPQGSSWGFDEKTALEYRRIDYYLSEKKTSIDMHPGQKKSEKTVSFHRPLQYYFKLLGNSGFSVTRLEEWISNKKSQTGPRQKEEDRMRKEIPLFLCLEANKV